MLHHQPMNLPGTTWNEVTNQIRVAPTMPNREFLEMFARPGRVGLACQASIPVASPRRATPTSGAERANVWTHAFIFEGRRLDGQHWVIACEFQGDGHGVSAGLQESRMSKYFDEGVYSALAVLDFKFSDDQMTLLLREGLELVACRARCSLRELLGHAALPQRPRSRDRSRTSGRERSMFCSAFFQCLFAKAGLDLAPALHANPDVLGDITRIALPHMTYLLKRAAPTPKAVAARPRHASPKVRPAQKQSR
jgi:hypothetical protein